MTYFSYIARSGFLIVRRLHSPAEIQELRGHMREYVGQFEAADIEHARNIANKLRGVTL